MPSAEPRASPPPDSVSGSDPKSVRTAYTGARQIVRTVTVAGDTGSGDVSVVETYDGTGQLVSVNEGGVTTSYTYDIGGRLATVATATAAGTQTRSFTYDNRGFLLEERHPELGVSGNGLTTYSEYDSRGHAHRRTTGPFDVRMTFDAAERITEVREIGVAPSRPLKQFQYDLGNPRANGRLNAAARFNYDPIFGTIAVTESYQYDGLGGRPSRRDRAIGSGTNFSGQSFFFSQAYNDLGEVDSLTYPCANDGAGCRSGERQRTVGYGYTRGALTSVTGWASLTYQPNGLVATVTHGSGSAAVHESWEPDPWGLARPRKITATNDAGTELWSTGLYEYDGAGNIRKQGTTSYRYDAFQRLAGWNDAAPGALAMSNIAYDEVGNQLHTSQQFCGTAADGVLRCSMTSILSNELVGTTNHYATHSYDAAGSVIGDGRRTFSYDALGMMTRAITTDARDFHYLYSVDDERIAVVERTATGNRTTWTVRDFANRALSMWTDTTVNSVRTIAWKEDTIWRGGSLLANATPTSTKHYTLDHLGSPRAITSPTGTLLGTQTFAPFGSGGTLDGGSLQFTAHERDAATVGDGTADLPDYMHARFYDVGRGRFLSVDPGGFDASRSQSWNRYTYASNNPVGKVDPDGRKDTYFQRAAAAAARAGAAVASYGASLNNGSALGTAADATLATAGDMIAGYGDMLNLGTSTGEVLEAGGDGYDVGMALSADLGRASGIVLTIAGGAQAARVPSTTVTGVTISTGDGAVSVPAGAVRSMARNGRGVVYTPAGSTGNAGTVRVAGANAQNPGGYARVYNQNGQPINVGTGKPGSAAATHPPLTGTATMQPVRVVPVVPCSGEKCPK